MAMTLGELINRRYRELEISSKRELAARAGVSVRALHGWIGGNGSEIRLGNLLKLARALRVHPIVVLRHATRDFVSYPVHSTPAIRFDDAGFIDESVADLSVVGSGTTFPKSWFVQNSGSVAWEGRKLVCQDGIEPLYVCRGGKYVPFETCSLKPEAQEIIVPNTAPGETVELAVEFTASTLPGRAVSIWKMTDQAGNLCYPNKPGYWCQVSIVGFF